jgi:two-component system nitrogen regulation response regulator NtrX
MAHDVLIVDDEADIRLLIGGLLGDEGYQTREAGDADSALEAIRNRRPNLVLLDIWLQGSRLDGLELLSEIKRDHPDVPVVMMTGHGSIETAVAAMKQGAYEFIEKPFQSDRLLLVMERAIESARMRRELEDLRRRAGVDEEILGVSPVTNQLRQTIERIAPTGSRVLITGPAGSGKEVAARMLHRLSKRAQGPIVLVNCAAMHPERMEAELFGVDASANGGELRIGTFEQAHGGTLVLDEVADMPQATQGKIVRTLQEQTFERVGGSRVEVDVRVVATSNRDPLAEIAAGRFREDLYYRLNVVPLRVPPLRERREDVPVLARHFMERAAQSSGVAARAFGEDALVALQSYDWPGNVRQLRNLVDWLLIMAPGESRDPIHTDMLPPEVGAITPAVARWDKSSEIMGLPLREAREVFEREYLLAQLTRFGGNISRTATFVDMERSALHRKLKLLGVRSDDKVRT